MMAFSQGFTALTVFAVISAIVWQADGLASTTTTYTDTGCTQELSVSSVFGAFIPSEDGSYLLGKCSLTRGIPLSAVHYTVVVYGRISLCTKYSQCTRA